MRGLLLRLQHPQARVPEVRLFYDHDNACLAHPKGRIFGAADTKGPRGAARKSSCGRRFGQISMAANLLLGYLAATVNLAITMPVEVRSSRCRSSRDCPA